MELYANLIRWPLALRQGVLHKAIHCCNRLNCTMNPFCLFVYIACSLVFWVGIPLRLEKSNSIQIAFALCL
jgi:hypothetical protein